MNLSLQREGAWRRETQAHGDLAQADEDRRKPFNDTMFVAVFMPCEFGFTAQDTLHARGDECEAEQQKDDF